MLDFCLSGGIICPDRLDLKNILKEVTTQTERIVIERILARTGQNRSQAARLLGISRRSLITKIQALGLDRDPESGESLRADPEV